MKIKIRVYSDYICPFCYLGKAIIAKLGKQFEIELEHLGVEIHPEIPKVGVDSEGKISGMDELYEHIRRRGKDYGLRFARSRCYRIQEVSHSKRVCPNKSQE